MSRTALEDAADSLLPVQNDGEELAEAEYYSDDYDDDNDGDREREDEPKDKKAPPPVYILDKEMEAHLLSVCQAVGGYEILDEDETAAATGTTDANTSSEPIGKVREMYILGDEGLDCLRDIKRFLRYDDRTTGKCVLRKLGEWRFLHTDLIPIFTAPEHAANQRLMEAIVEIMVPLTWPLEPTEPAFTEQSRYLSRYKVTMTTDKNVMTSLFRFLLKPLSKDHRERTDRDVTNIRTGLTLCRNLLSIPDPEASDDISAEMVLKASMQERLIRQISDQHLLDLFISLAGSMDENSNAEWNLIILEIFHLIFISYDPADLLEPPEKDENLLLKSLLQAETNKKLQFKSARHNRFGGSIMVQSGVHAQRVVSGTKPLNAQIDGMFEVNKKNFVSRDRKTKFKDLSGIKKRITNDHFRKLLREAADMFLESCFNILMTSVKKDLAAERMAVREVDYERYLSLVTFFLNYQQEKAERFGMANVMSVYSIAGALDRMSVIFVLKQIDKHYSDKKPIPLRVSINSFTQMLGIIRLMHESDNDDLHSVAENLLSNLFYERAHMDLLRTVVRFPISLTRSFLEDLVAMNHALLRTLEKYTKEKNVVFMRKKQKAAKAKGANGENLEETMQGEDEEEEEDDQDDYTYQEKALAFDQIEMGYANESVVTTYYYLLRDYEQLKPETIACIVKMFHRIFVKCEMHPLFYKLEILDLFDEIMTNRILLSRKHPVYKEFVNFIRFVVSRMVKKFAEYPLLYVEILYPKSKRSDITRIQNNGVEEMDLGEFGDAEGQPSGPVEFEVSTSIPWNERVGVLVGLMMEEDKREMFAWIIRTMQEAATAREEEDASNDHLINSANDDFQQALTNDGHLRALLGLFHFEEREVPGENAGGENAGEDAPVIKNWYISFTILANDLHHYAATVEEYLERPLETEKPLAKLIKKKKAKAPRISNRAERGERSSKQPRPEKPDKFLSAQFVEDSSDDEETKLVAEYRARMDNMRNAEYQLAADDAAEEISQIQRQLEQLSQAPVRRRHTPKKRVVGEEGNEENENMDEDDAGLQSSLESAGESDRDDLQEDEASAQETDDEDAKDTSSDSSDSDNDSDQENVAPREEAPLVKTVQDVVRDEPQNAVNKRRRLLIADDSDDE